MPQPKKMAKKDTKTESGRLLAKLCPYWASSTTVAHKKGGTERETERAARGSQGERVAETKTETQNQEETERRTETENQRRDREKEEREGGRETWTWLGFPCFCAWFHVSVLVFFPVFVPCCMF